jgi:hypothetical protein
MYSHLESELLRSYNDNGHTRPIFSSDAYNDMTEDDHTPFLGYSKTTNQLFKYLLIIK